MTRPLFGAVVMATIVMLTACGPARSIRDAIRPPAATQTPSWVGKTADAATPMPSFQSRVADRDERTGRPIGGPVALRQGPGRGAEPNGTFVQPGEQVLLIGVEVGGNERFFLVRSFDGLRRGWLAEAALVESERPPS